MNKLVIANMKMNLSIDEIKIYLDNIKSINTDKIIFCPSTIYIPYFLKENLNVGIQNISSHENGAYTGEISVLQASSLGVQYAIVGHSEVKKLFNENNLIINKKLKLCLNNNIIPILCIGEEEKCSLEKIKQVIKKQLEESLNNIKDIGKIIIAYESNWKIGSNEFLNVEEIEDIILFIKQFIYQKYKISDIMVLYGGSINYYNIKSINSISCLDGVLIGNYSIDIN
jgi:triosephosphate isomerase